MNRKEYTFLLADRNTLIQLIKECQDEESILDRISFESRLQEVEEELQHYSYQKLPIQGTITFRGKPVLGSQGIESVFASKIMDDFSSLISTRAASYQGTLNDSGKIPNRDLYRLNITGIAVGSFGFTFEEKTPNNNQTNHHHR